MYILYLYTRIRLDEADPKVPRTDQIFYQTKQYHHATFGYEIPVNKDGDYVLILKFCEVYFSSPGMKVFVVTLNGVHTIVSDLDIFSKVGKGVAHDERISFTGYRDNPKVNAIYVARWSATDVPQLPSLASDEKDEEEATQKGKKHLIFVIHQVHAFLILIKRRIRFTRAKNGCERQSQGLQPFSSGVPNQPTNMMQHAMQ
ncbi:UNVERIFIED_CONTAM: Mlec [Trichonephila clavipes]